MEQLHYTNHILPPSVVSHIESDDKANWDDIVATMVKQAHKYSN